MVNSKLVFVAISTLLLFGTAEAQDQVEQPWWPHPIWGSDDQVGASNWITAEKILSSLSVVETGKLYELGFPYENGMALVGSRSYELVLPETSGPSEDGLLSHGEKLTTNIGQIGTQFDGLGHVGRRVTLEGGEQVDAFYNGFTVDEVYAPDGLQKLGIENVKPIITRGILIDIAGYKDMKTLPEGYVVTMADVRNALTRQDVDEGKITPGDALLFNFGWWRKVGDHERYVNNLSWAGIDGEVAQWVLSKKASMFGSDASGDPPDQRHVHFELLMKNGIYNLEFMNFESLLEDKVYEFLFVFTPIAFKGATGSPGRPIAIR